MNSDLQAHTKQGAPGNLSLLRYLHVGTSPNQLYKRAETWRQNLCLLNSTGLHQHLQVPVLGEMGSSARSSHTHLPMNTDLPVNPPISLRSLQLDRCLPATASSPLINLGCATHHLSSQPSPAPLPRHQHRQHSTVENQDRLLAPSFVAASCWQIKNV